MQQFQEKQSLLVDHLSEIGALGPKRSNGKTNSSFYTKESLIQRVE